MYRSKSSILATLIIVAVLVAAVVALGVFSSGFTNWDLTTWFDESESQNPYINDKDTSDDVNAPIIDIGESVGNGVSFTSTVIPRYEYEDYGVSMLAENAYTLTATISPSSASNKLVDWSLAWKNESSSWASGKNVSDYINISPSSNGSLTAVVSCLDAFAEQIIISCAARDNSDIFATCSVDYRERIIDPVFKITINSKSYVISNGSSVPSLTKGSLAFNFNKSVGTIAETFNLTAATVSLTSDYISQLTSRYGSSWGTGFDNVINIPVDSSFNFSDFFYDIIEPNIWGSYPNEMCFAEICDWTKSLGINILTFNFTVKASSSTDIYSYNCKFSDMAVPVGDVSLNEDSIVF